MLDARTDEGLGVSAISCWEVAKLVEHERLSFPQDVAVGLRSPLRILEFGCFS
jgi:PIN domain nuclease of toxin-antitoxin system